MRLSTLALALLLLLTAWTPSSAQIEVAPDSLFFPCTLVQGASARLIHIRNIGSETIEEIEYDVSEIGPSAFICGKKFKDRIPPGGSRIDTIWFRPTKAGPTLGRLEITAKDRTDHERSSVVWMLGQGVDPDRLRITYNGTPLPSKGIHFSPTKLGDTLAIPLTISNPSCAPAVIVQKFIDGDDKDQFSIIAGSQRPDTVDNTHSSRLVVGFIPTKQGMPGRRHAQLVIATRDGSIMTVDMEGDDPGPGPSAGAELDFGRVPVGATLLRSPALTSSQGPSITINQIVVTGPNSGEFNYLGPTPPFDVGGGAGDVRVPIEFAPTSEGEKEAEFEAWHGPTDPARLRLRGIGIRNPFSVTPALLNMGVVSAGLTKTIADTIKVCNLGGPPVIPFRIDSVRLAGRNPENFSVDGTDAGQWHGQEEVPYSVAFSPDTEKTYAAVATFYLSLGIDGSIKMKLSVQLTGNGAQGRPHVQPIASEYDFGNIPVNTQSSPILIGIVNVGNEPDTIAQYTDNLGEFTISSTQQLPFTLKPHVDTLWLSCTFFPTSVGIKSADINIVPRITQGFTITLRGTSRRPDIWPTIKTIDMGEVAIGHSRTAVDTLVVHNGGSTPITLTSAQIIGPNAGAFSLSAPSVSTIGDNGQATFDITFSPTKAGPFTATAEIMTEGAGVITVELSGTGVSRAELTWLEAPYELGTVAVGDTIVRRIGLINSGTADESVLKIEAATPADRDFGLTLPGFPVTLLAGGFDTLWVDAAFVPSTSGPHSLRIEAEGATTEASATISGTGTPAESDPPPAPLTAWLDSAETQVNTPFTLTLRLSKPLDATDGITQYRAEIRYPVSALYIHNVSGIGSNAAQQRFGDIIVITGTSPVPISGDALFTLDMQGLVTGKSQNIVEVLDLTLGTETHIPADDGQVRLHGCDIDYGVAYGKPTTITAITPAPIDQEATIRYYAPSGGTPTLRLVDVTGREVLNREMNQGTGSEQEESVSFSDVQNGFYLLELRLGSQISTQPILISR